MALHSEETKLFYFISNNIKIIYCWSKTFPKYICIHTYMCVCVSENAVSSGEQKNNVNFNSPE
jgi:hypothetical protein